MLTYFQAIVLGLLQGITELFPISSLGHTVILPSVFGWHINQDADFFIVFLVATHLATALVLLAFYLPDWLKIARGFFRTLVTRKIDSHDPYQKLSWLIVIATIPAGFLGLLFEHKLRDFFAEPGTVALFLIANGALLYGTEILRRRRTRLVPERHSPGALDAATARLSFTDALRVGVMQCLALLPGFSRTGATLAGGLLSGLSHESAVRFSFLLATPIIFAAAALKLPALLLATHEYPVGPILAGSVAAAIAAYLSVRFLTHYFRNIRSIVPFAFYCVCAGSIALLFIY